MTNLLFLSDIFEKTIHIVSRNESLVDIALLTKIPPHFIIKDNNLTSEPQCGDLLILKKRGQMKIMDLETLNRLSETEKQNIMLANGINYLFVGLMYV